ncbi:MAG: hypothetical protein VXX25_01310 [Verrucomicrobiota bacterium]|nr:hypothetical protein [Verrucomicrobiota bacterium]
MNIEKIKSSVRSAKVISFDLFDTLFYRPYLNPNDLFFHLEMIYKKPLYADQRIISEKNTRFLSSKEEITYDQIYDNIDENFKDMKDKELSLEFKSILLNEEVKDLYDYAKSLRKKVIFTSDMYLPARFVEKLLTKFEINDYSALYVSSELNLTKHRGSLFKKVISDLNCTPEDILHIGDNKKSDFIIPKKMGIKAVHYLSLNDSFKNSSAAKKLQYELFDSGDSDFLQRLFFKQKINKIFVNKKPVSFEKYWENIGYYYGSFIALSYYNLLSKHFNSTKDELIFVGRDGYSLKLFFDVLKPQWKSHYINLPRILVEKCDYPIDLNDEENIDFLYDLLNQSEEEKSFKNKQQVVSDNINYIEAQLINKKQVYTQYLKKNNINLSKRLIIVDSATNNFTIQRFLSSISKNDVFGIYFYVRSNLKHDFNYESVCDLGYNRSPQEGEAQFIQFVEYILSAPHELAIDIDPQTFDLVFKKEDHESRKRVEIKRLIDQGTKNGAIFIKSFISDDLYQVNSKFLINNINLFINYPEKEDAHFFKKIKMTLDYKHHDYMPFLSSDYSFFKIIFSSKNEIKDFKRIKYYNKFQILAMAIRYPILVKSSWKKKFIRISVFPYLNETIVKIRIAFFSFAKIDLNVGKFIPQK